MIIIIIKACNGLSKYFLFEDNNETKRQMRRGNVLKPTTQYSRDLEPRLRQTRMAKFISDFAYFSSYPKIDPPYLPFRTKYSTLLHKSSILTVCRSRKRGSKSLF